MSENEKTVSPPPAIAVPSRKRPGAPRQPYRKWLWLRQHPRRAELVALVLSTPGVLNPNGASSVPLKPAELKPFNLTREQLDLIRRDAAAVRAVLAGQSWRQVAQLAKPEMTHEGWRKVVRLYRQYRDELFDVPTAAKPDKTEAKPKG